MKTPTTETLGWALHDFVVHPVTGVMLLVAKVMPWHGMRLRLAALAHHMHNVSSPANDALADYADAARRAGCNETRRDPVECRVCGVNLFPNRVTWPRQEEGYERCPVPKHKDDCGLVCVASELSHDQYEDEWEQLVGRRHTRDLLLDLLGDPVVLAEIATRVRNAR